MTTEEEFQNRMDRNCKRFGVEEMSFDEQIYFEQLTLGIAHKTRRDRRTALAKVKNKVSKSMYRLVCHEVQRVTKINHIKRDLSRQGACINAVAEVEKQLGD